MAGTLSLDIFSETRLALDSYYSGFAKWTTSRAYPARHARNFGTARMRIPTMSLTRAMWMSGRDVPRERDRRTFVPVQTGDFAHRVSCKRTTKKLEFSRSGFAASYTSTGYAHPALLPFLLNVPFPRNREIPRSVFPVQREIRFLFVYLFRYEVCSCSVPVTLTNCVYTRAEESVPTVVETFLVNILAVVS